MANPSILHVIKSVFAAFIGIQSKENRELDFTKGKISHYVGVGIAMTILFIVLLVFIVSMVIGLWK